MQRCFRIAGAAAARTALRRWRRGAAPRAAVVHGTGCLLACAAGIPLANAARHQATTPDKRFHCSVCKKAFRLEMAAKLHLQQAHGGEGAVEAGAGPGAQEEQATPAPVGVFRNAPPQAPTVVTAVPVDPHERLGRREKPAPKPLHEAEREVPNLVMEKMLSVWDNMGVKRIGSQFVHSSMVMRVFAARPSDSGESLYGVVSVEGENPFEGGGSAVTAAAVDEAELYTLRMTDAYATASTEALGPFRPARVLNPFFMKVSREAGKVAARTEVTEEQTAPVTPFGQLPVFGQAQAPPPPPPSPAQEVSAEAPSESGDGTLVSSPFAAGVESSPFAGTAASPFDNVGYSPFATEEEEATTPTPATDTADTAAVANPAAGMTAGGHAPSPFVTTAATAAASPFAASPFAAAASPFAPSPFATADGAAASTSGFSGSVESFTYAATPMPAAEAAPVYTCTVCEKSFTTSLGLGMHSKVKHGIDVPKTQDAPKKRVVPDLPAYIPSPVDLSMTSPFGSASHSTAWTEVELTPYAQAMSNMTIAGTVLDASASEDGGVLLAVQVTGTETLPSEIISVQCSAEAMKAVGDSLRRDDYIFACGSLRLLPVVDESTKKTFTSAVVFVTTPTGIVARLH